MSVGTFKWLGQLSVRLLILAQVTMSQFMGLSPPLGSTLTMWNLSGILSVPSSACCMSLTQNK